MRNLRLKIIVIFVSGFTFLWWSTAYAGVQCPPDMQFISEPVCPMQPDEYCSRNGFERESAAWMQAIKHCMKDLKTKAKQNARRRP
jgi:hypothetical protein